MIDKGTAYLFIDDAHIESLEGATKGVVPAQEVSDQPLIEKDEPWEEESSAATSISSTTKIGGASAATSISSTTKKKISSRCGMAWDEN